MKKAIVIGGINRGWVREPDLSEAKAARIALIKVEAAERIRATDWKKERATERNDGTLQAVLDEREAIRTASDAAETAVNALTTLQAIQEFTW